VPVVYWHISRNTSNIILQFSTMQIYSRHWTDIKTQLDMFKNKWLPLHLLLRGHPKIIIYGRPLTHSFTLHSNAKSEWIFVYFIIKKVVWTYRKWTRYKKKIYCIFLLSQIKPHTTAFQKTVALIHYKTHQPAFILYFGGKPTPTNFFTIF